MKVLFVSPKDADYIASCLWDGFQELCGEENVYDAVDSPVLHSYGIPERGIASCAAHRISASRKGKFLADDDRKTKFDLMVINATILREYDWHLPNMLRESYLKPEGKIAYVEGWDSSRDINVPINIVPDVVFRRELNPDVAYPYQCHCLMMSAPLRWFNERRDRELDVFFGANNTGWESRWDSCRMAFSTNKKHMSFISSCGIFRGPEYFDYLSRAKLAICPNGAGGESFDCLRTWEAVANGSIPIFVGLPKRIKEPWFEDDEYFECSEASQLPAIIDRALDMDLPAMRVKMQANAKQNHTTKARAKRILDILGMTP